MTTDPNRDEGGLRASSEFLVVFSAFVSVVILPNVLLEVSRALPAGSSHPESAVAILLRYLAIFLSLNGLAHLAAMFLEPRERHTTIFSAQQQGWRLGFLGGLVVAAVLLVRAFYVRL
ncbi:MAG: hypothetical protein NXI18_21885 [Alphaproteobacteria bacterium]|nr:hypothetical protein [Alphaproteobacteria bacterium]